MLAAALPQTAFLCQEGDKVADSGGVRYTAGRARPPHMRKYFVFAATFFRRSSGAFFVKKLWVNGPGFLLTYRMKNVSRSESICLPP